MKKKMSLLLVLALVLTMLPMSAFAEAVAPAGYTATKDGHMAYKVRNNTSIDVVGHYDGRYVITTFVSAGYTYRYENMNNTTQEFKAASVSGGRYVKLSVTVTAGSSAVTDGKLGVHADIMIDDNDKAAVEVIKNGDKAIGIKMVNDKAGSPSENAQFSLYFADSAGVTDVDTYWFGHYSERQDKYDQQLGSENASRSGTYNADYTTYTGADSAFAVSWQNITLAPGESKTYSIIVGVGEVADPIQWGVGALTLDRDTVNYGESANVTAVIQDAPALNEELYVSIDGGEEILLGNFSSGNGTASATFPLDSQDMGVGVHELTFWVMNEEGAMTPLDTKTFSVNALNTAASDFVYTAPDNLTYDGTAKVATVVPADSVTGMGAITVKYYKDGVQTQPIHAGTYQVKIDVAASSKYAAITDLTDPSWTFTVAPKAIYAEWGATMFLPYTGDDKLITPVATGLLGGDTCQLTTKWVETTPGVGVLPGDWTATVDTVSNPDYTIINHTTTIRISNGHQDAPTLSKSDETIRGKNDGKIIGLTTAMEYSTEFTADDDKYTKITDPDMLFAPGTYYVRYQAKQYYNHSTFATITIGEGRALMVTYVADGVTIDTQELTYGANATAPQIPTKEGYTQTAPYWDHNGQNITQDTTINAVYTINRYTVTYMADGQEVDCQLLEHGNDAVAPAVPAKIGYDKIAPYWDHDGKNITQDTTINAVYTVNIYTVTYMADGETVDTQLVEYGQSAAIPPVPEKEGYTGAWDKELGPITEDTTVTAVYTIKTYTVTLMADGKVVGALSVEHGKTPTLPEPPAKEGYTVTWDKEVSPVTGDVTYTAVYTPVPETPPTGDNMPIGLMITILVISGLTLAGLLVGKKKRIF